MTRVIGLTGGIACGKSLVAGYLRELGVPVIDADRVAREVVTPPSTALDEIRDTFGPAVLQDDGSLDREKMAELAFGDPVLRAKLEAILHPEIERRVEDEIARHTRAGTPALVYEAALLVETGLYRRLDALIVVTASAEQQLERLEQQRGLTRSEARARIESQLPQDAKVRLADVVVDNSGTPEETRSATIRAWSRLERCLARGRTPSGKLVGP